MTMRVEGIATRGKGGAALITAIVFVFFLTLFGLAFYQLGETDIDLFGHEEDLSQALYASEAGIEKVRWMLREVPDANPFSNTYNEENAKSIANPTSGDFFPGEADKPYFKVSMIQAAGNKVQVKILGSVDVDADGEAGLTSIEDVFAFDPDDVNRTFEAYIGLPGTLGEKIGGKGISAGAGAFYAGGVGVSLSSESRLFVTPDGDSMTGFLYRGGPTPVGNWDQWGFIFSDPVKTGEIELPSGIFDDTTGEYIDEDTDTIPDYFQHLSPRTYAVDQTFTSSVDPTAGAAGRDVIYVKGNITIDGVDFGYLDAQGNVRSCDWEKTDLAFIANGDITVRRVDCGNVGRLVLVAKNIILEGDYNTKVNGIAIAFNDITLDGDPPDGGSGCDYGILTHQTDYSRSVKYTAYFLGTMVAGNHINLLRDGWTVIYDENVINGLMYSAVPRAFLTYERVEAEDFNTTNNWDLDGDELKYTQEDYIWEDLDKADYGDVGIDGIPDLMKMYLEPIWRHTDPEPDERDKHDFPISDSVYCDFTDPANVFEDPDISVGPQDWYDYTTIHLWMALDNWQKTFLTKTTRRQSYFRLRLEDAGGNRISLPLSYPNNNWLTEPGKINWKLVRISLQLVDPLSNFDMTNVVRMEFYYNDIRVSWYINDIDREWIGYDNVNVDVDGDGEYDYGDDGYYYYMKFNPLDPPNPTKYPIQFKPPDANNRRQLYYEDPPFTTPLGTGTPDDIQWNWDPSTPILSADMYFKDTVAPERSALDSVLKVDRIELPGKPATNDHLEYGLPQCLRLEVSNWQEFQ